MKKTLSLAIVSILLISILVFSFTANAAQSTSDMLNIKFQLKSGTTAQSTSTAARFIASVNKLEDYSKVGWVFSLTDETPTKEEGCVCRENNVVYTSIIADGNRLYPRDIYGNNGYSNYLFVFEMTEIPQSKFSGNIYVRAYVVLEGGEIIYGAPTALNITNELNEQSGGSSGSETTSSDNIKLESSDSGWDDRWY